MEKFIAVYNKKWKISDIEDLIDSSNVIRHYSPDTYWEPGEDYIDFDVELDNEFKEVVKIAEFYFFGENEDTLELPYAAVIDHMTYCFNEQENWEELLNYAGWNIFEDAEYEDTREAVETKIEEWTNKIAEEKAWSYIENLKYGDY